MKYIRFKTLSTGYIGGSVPPQFSDSHKKPIDLLGSDGVCCLDGRLNLDSMVNYAYQKILKHNKKSSIIGFEIIRANDFLEEGKIIFRTIFENFKKYDNKQ